MKFKRFLEAEEGLVVYCDLDGVLTDLRGGVSELTNEPLNTDNQAMRALVLLRRNNPQVFADGKFWEDLNWTPHGREIWNAIQPYDPVILTGAVSGVEADVGKQKWVERELGLPANRIIFSTTKHEYARPNAVLIDDTQRNIDNWEQHDGIGILHSDANYQNTLMKLQALSS